VSSSPLCHLISSRGSFTCSAVAEGRATLLVYSGDIGRLLLPTFLRNLLQQQKSVRNHAKMQLQQNAQQKWLQVTQTMMLF